MQFDRVIEERVLDGSLASRAAALTSRHGDAIGSIASAFTMQSFLIVSGVVAARALGVEDRGHFALLSITPVIMAQVATLGLPLATTYFIVNENVAPASLFGSLARPVAVLTLLLLGIHWTVLLLALRGQEHDIVMAGLMTAIVAPGVVSQLFGLAVLQGQQRFKEFNLLRPLPLLAHGLLLGMLFVLGAASLPMVALSWAGTVLTCGFLTLGLALRGTKHQTDLPTEVPSTGKLLRFGLRSIGGHVTPVETFRVDQLVAGVLLGPIALGLYAVALSFTNLPRMIGQSVGMVAYPRVAAKATSPSVRQTLLKFIGAVALVNALLVTLLAIAAGWLVPFFFGNEFTGAVAIVRVLLLYSLILSIRRVLLDSLRGMDRGGLGSLGEMASWPVLALSLGLLHQEYGVVGVAWALVAYATASLLVTGGFAYSRAFAKTNRPPRPKDNPARLREAS